ncbi:collagen alpha-1(XXIII) chain-like isoform X5 [Narcine bancroftii]|uniref:collagen alpha-1(XXIII) chain-like isoform X5 n=1 Tax=Narcine bancroftii TaxID=1343680 RepID=UPI00383101E2
MWCNRKMAKNQLTLKTGECKKLMVPISDPTACLMTLPTLVSLLLSIASVGFCLLLTVKIAVLQDKVKLLENQKRSISLQAARDNADLLFVLQKRIDQLQEELSNTVGKIRTVREVTPECLCPPGPPGKRGRTGRRGAIGFPVSASDATELIKSTEENQEEMAIRALLDWMESQAFLDQKEKRVIKVTLDQQVLQVLKEFQEKMVHVDFQEFQV